MSASWKVRLVDNHQPRWSATLMWTGYAIALFAIQGVMIQLINANLLAWCIPLILVLGYIKHCHLIAFHETSHRNLCPWPRLNDAIGLFIGTLGFMSLTLYRAVHRDHHVHQATEKDEEFWPFVDTSRPRWFRRLSAALEMTIGLIYTPLLFVRCYLRKGSSIQDRETRRLIGIELLVVVGLWASILAVTAWWSLWTYLLVLYVAPSMLAGNIQTLRKYVEHMGLTGSTALSATRSIVPVGVVDRFIVATLFHEPYHGIHHRYAHLPQVVFPEFTELLEPTAPSELKPYSSYAQAFWEMVGSLHDPRIGAQWVETREAVAAPSLDQEKRLSA